MESTEQNADYSIIQNHPQTSVETNAAMPSDAHSDEAAEILGPSSEGRSLPGVIDLTAQPDSIQFIGEDTRITQLRALYKTFRDIRQNSFLSSATIPNELLDILPLMMEGAVRMYRSPLKPPMALTYLRNAQTGSKQKTKNFTVRYSRHYMEAIADYHTGKADTLQSNFNYIEHALENMKATSRDLEKAVVKELRRNEFLKIENSRLEKGLQEVMSTKRGSTEVSDNDEPRKSGFVRVEVHWVEVHWVEVHWVEVHWVEVQWVEDYGWAINGSAITGWKIIGWAIIGWMVIGPIPALKPVAPFEEENSLISASDPDQSGVKSFSARIGREILQWDVLILKHLPAIEFGPTRSQST
ncbi:hypothetical protein V498_02175 [Pseudogymnoascus sp. VKM F-4517 (FW-2822)]|nr:hypothetical protein V498_02175 [Pseudogymnoascus sp. VKM F-4517 (FW-2822)]